MNKTPRPGGTWIAYDEDGNWFEVDNPSGFTLGYERREFTAALRAIESEIAGSN